MSKSWRHAGWPGVLKVMSLLLILAADLPSEQILTQTAFPGGGELVVKVLEGASLRIRGRNRDDVEILARTARPLSASDWSWLSREAQAVFTLETAVRGEIEIRLPQGVRLVIESNAGSVFMDGLKGTVAGRIACGFLTLDRLSGVVDLQLDCGDARIEHCQAIGRVVVSDGQLWCEDVSSDLVLITGFGGGRVLVGDSDGKLTLDAKGLDLWLSASRGKGALSVHAEDGFVRIDAAQHPVVLDVQTGGCEVMAAGAELDMQLVGAQGRVSMSRKVDALNNWRLKCVDAVLDLIDPDGVIAGLMLAVKENKNGVQDLFLGLPFQMMLEIKKSSTLQLRRLSAGSDIKAELRSAALVLPAIERELKE